VDAKQPLKYSARGRKPPMDVRPFAAVTGGLVIFGGVLALGIPAAFAVGAAAVAFGLGYSLLPRPKSAAEIVLAPDVTQAMLDDFLARGGKGLDKLRELNLQIHKVDMSKKVDGLCDVIEHILDNCKKDPQDIRSARSFDFYLDKLAQYLSGYIELLDAGSKLQNPDTLKRLTTTEQLIDRATLKFQELHQAMLENDLRTLEAKSGALQMMFGNDEPTAPGS
jgi:hypothetical protein